MSTLACPKCGSTDVQPAGAEQYRCAQCNSTLGLYPLPGTSQAFCPQCRAPLVQDALYCHQCGAWAQTLVAVRPCASCGRTAPITGSFCPYCRAPISLPEESGQLGEWALRHRETAGCPACGQTIGPTAQTCPYCHVNVEAFLAPLRQQAMSGVAAFDKAHGYDTELLDKPPERIARRKLPSQPEPARRTFVYVVLWLALLTLAGLALLMLVIQLFGRG